MRRAKSIVLVVVALVAMPALAQETPPAMVGAYEALADTILALRTAEAALVRSLLDGHYHAAEVLMKQGNWEGAAAQMALFASEGDNAVGGVRKRLLEGGHHFNATGEEAGIYEPGFVMVTKDAKQKLLAASSDLRRAGDDAARKAAWMAFSELAKELLGGS